MMIVSESRISKSLERTADFLVDIRNEFYTHKNIGEIGIKSIETGMGWLIQNYRGQSDRLLITSHITLMLFLLKEQRIIHTSLL